VQEAQVSEELEMFPPTRGHVTPLIDGRAAFAEMHGRLAQASQYIYMNLWYLQLATELLDRKGNATKFTDLIGAAARREVRIFIILSFLEGQTIEVAGQKFAFGFAEATPAAKIKAALLALHKRNISVVVAKHPHRIALDLKFLKTEAYPVSYHEKLVIVDGRYAFCGGLEFDRPYTLADPLHKRSDRHDVHSMLEGPIVKHLAQHFVVRWNEVKGEDNPALPAAIDGFEPGRTTHAVQVAITKSVDAGRNKFVTRASGIYDSYVRAISEAELYVYIENQYFRERLLVDALVNRLVAKPALCVLILLPVRAEEDPSDFTDHAEFVQFDVLRRLQKAGGDRVAVYSERRSAEQSIYVHSKLMIVDDRWLTIGSANTNPRSFFLDAEVNIVVTDPKMAQDLRTALWIEHLLNLDPTAPSKQAAKVLADFKSKISLAKAKDFPAVWHDHANRRIFPHRPPKGVEEKKLDWKRVLDKLKVPSFLRKSVEAELPTIEEVTKYV
jgi:phosphatidylserine/phosphatidylglycerophosphate/cardiolipin synthase-like enzyme